MSNAKPFATTPDCHESLANAIHSLQKSDGILEIGLEDTFIANDSGSIDPGLPAGEYIELTVTDNGSGVGPAIIDFFQTIFHKNRSRRRNWHGLSDVSGTHIQTVY